jgi:uncharacterized protein (TIGR02118 family)
VIKLMFLLTKQPSLSYDQFFTYLAQVHAPLVGQLPGARRYVIDAVMPGASLATPVCDAVEEIWFDSMASMHDALASDEGRLVIEDRQSFSAADTDGVVVEELEVSVS